MIKEEVMHQVDLVTHLSARAKLTYYNEDKAIWVSHVEATDRRKGHARGLLMKICELADAQGYDLELEVGRFGFIPGPTNDQLKLFYMQFGFQQMYQFRPMLLIRKIYGPYNEAHSFTTKE